MIGRTNIKGVTTKKINFIEYIESTGTQYINTGVPANINLKVVANIMALGSGFPFGVIPTVDVQCYGIEYTSNNKRLQSYFGTKGTNGNYPGIGGLLSTNSKVTLTANDTRKFILGKTTFANYTTTNNTLEFGPLPISIFTANGVHLNSRISMRLYAFQMYDNAVLVRDFVPALDENNVAGLWDKVDEKFYYNQGTGTFNAGPVVV